MYLNKILVFLLLVSSTLYGAPFTTHGLIILLDEEEYKEEEEVKSVQEFDATAMNLFAALEQKAAPIVVSSSLLKYLFMNKKLLINETQLKEQDLEEWLYKKINDSLYLLIPKKDVLQKIVAYNPPSAKTFPLTQLELKLGLKVDHFETVTMQDIMDAPLHQGTLDQDFMMSLEQLFVLNSDYSKPSFLITKKPRWAIYINGHTNMGQSIQELIKTHEEALKKFYKEHFPHEKDPEQVIQQVETLLNNARSMIDEAAKEEQLLETAEGDQLLTIIISFYNYFEKAVEYFLEATKILDYDADWFINAYTATTKAKKHFNGLSKLESTERQQKLTNYSKHYKKNIRENLNALQSNTILIDDIEIIKQELKQLKNELLKAKALKNLGLKTIDTRFVGLNINSFIRFTEFLEYKILTGLLFFNTCYGGGQNLQTIYQNLNKSMVQKIFSYTIGSATLSDSLVSTYYIYDKINKQYSISINFSNFFNNLKQEGPIDFVKIFNGVNRFLKDGKLRYYENIPLLKLPGLEWASVIDVPNKIVSIGSSLARSRDPNKPLDISTFFAGRLEKQGQKTTKRIYPGAILLYADEIQFPLIVAADPTQKPPEPPAFISMIPGDAVHEFANIDAQQFVFSEISKAFFKLPQLYPQKVFLIKEFTVKNNLDGLPIKNGTVMTLNNVVLFNNTVDALGSQNNPTNGIYFTISGHYFMSWWNTREEYPELFKNLTPLKVDYLDNWLKKAAEIKSENQPESSSIYTENLKELKKFMEKRVQQKKLPVLVERSIEEKAESKQQI